MKREGWHHRKTARLMRLLKVPRYVAMGILESLFLLTATQAEDGAIGRKLTNQDIADGIEWTDDCDVLVGALIDAGWLDRHPTHRLVVHDWHDHCPDWVTKRMERGEKREARRFASLPDPAPDEPILTADTAPPAPHPAQEAQNPVSYESVELLRTAADNGGQRTLNQPPRPVPKVQDQPARTREHTPTDMRGPPPGSRPPKPGAVVELDLAGWLAGPEPPDSRRVLAALGIREPALSALVSGGITPGEAAAEWAGVKADRALANKPRVLAVRLAGRRGIRLPAGKSLRGALGTESARLERLRAQGKGPAP